MLNVALAAETVPVSILMLEGVSLPYMDKAFAVIL